MVLTMTIEARNDAVEIVPEDSPARTSTRSRETLDRIAITEAEAKASQASMEAFGAMLRMIAESPGINGAIENIGRAAVLNAEAHKLAIETKHEQEMQAAKLGSEERLQSERLRHAAARQARWISAAAFAIIVAAILGLAAAMIALVVKGVLTHEHAIIIGGAVGTLIVSMAQKFKAAP